MPPDAETEESRVSKRRGVRASHRPDGARTARLRAQRAPRADALGQGVAALRSEGAAVPERHRDLQDPRYVLGADPLAAEKQTAAARARTRDATQGMPGQARWRAAGSRARSGGARDDRVRTDA